MEWFGRFLSHYFVHLSTPHQKLQSEQGHREATPYASEKSTSPSPCAKFQPSINLQFFLGSLHIYHHPCMKVAVMVLTTWVLYQRHRVATFGTAQPTGTRLQLFGLTAIQKGMEKGWRHVEAIRSGGISWI